MAVELPANVRKSVFAIHIRPMKGRISLTGRKLQIALAREAGQQYKALPEAVRADVETSLRRHVAELRQGRKPEVAAILKQPRFFVDLRSLADAVGWNPAEGRKLVDPLRELQAVQVEFNVHGHRSSAEERELYPDDLHVIASLISSIVRTGRGVVSWGYDPLIFSTMVNPRTYAVLSMELVRNARTYAALALYENVKRFVSIGQAGPYPLRLWQELLSEDGKVPAWETPAEFRRKIKQVLAHLRDMESGCDIDVEMQEKKRPEPVIWFKVKPRAQSRLVFGAPLPADRELVAELQSLGFSPEEIRSTLDTEDEDYVRYHLALLRKRQARTDQEPVHNPGAWLRKALTEDYRNEAERKLEDLKAKEGERRLAAAAASQKEAFARFRAVRAKERWGALDATQQDAWRTRFDASQGGAANRLKSDTLRQAHFLAWLAEQPGYLTRPEETDPVAWQIWSRDG